MVKKIGKSVVSATLMDLHTRRMKGIYSFDSIKVYVQREQSGWEGSETLALCNVRG